MPLLAGFPNTRLVRHRRDRAPQSSELAHALLPRRLSHDRQPLHAVRAGEGERAAGESAGRKPQGEKKNERDGADGGRGGSGGIVVSRRREGSERARGTPNFPRLERKRLVEAKRVPIDLHSFCGGLGWVVVKGAFIFFRSVMGEIPLLYLGRARGQARLFRRIPGPAAPFPLATGGEATLQ